MDKKCVLTINLVDKTDDSVIAMPIGVFNSSDEALDALDKTPYKLNLPKWVHYDEIYYECEYFEVGKIKNTQ